MAKYVSVKKPKAEKKKDPSKWITILVPALVFAAMAFYAFREVNKEKPNDVLYAGAVVDAQVVESSEIKPLVALFRESAYVRWDEAGEKVLLYTLTQTPEAFPEGETLTAETDLWCVSVPEFDEKYDSEKEGTDLSLRTLQYFGQPEDAQLTHIAAVWVKAEDVVRPAYQPDPTKQMTLNLTDGSALGDLEEWFTQTKETIYTDENRPWTGLGYTFDWADNGSDYGLTEFLIRSGLEFTVESVKEL